MRPSWRNFASEAEQVSGLIDASSMPTSESSHGLVVEIMDQAWQAGVVKMAIAIKPKESRSEK